MEKVEKRKGGKDDDKPVNEDEKLDERMDDEDDKEDEEEDSDFEEEVWQVSTFLFQLSASMNTLHVNTNSHTRP
jgi:hypothetical protein